MRALLLKWKSSSREANVDELKDLTNPVSNLEKWNENPSLKQSEERLSVVEMPLTETDNREMIDFFHFMLAGGTAKFFACSLAYPHGLWMCFFFVCGQFLFSSAKFSPGA